ncbi:T9SS type A sorting domain-containing protein [Arachidicoccus ginsenosidivorans]|uniref:T9SS type A sorting domain-containing protein n=1 Tax=Arachidicoccus ginsenosidivorans TaxID=496057 RepID=A0A5B8VNP7_9BACT|nr:T9SS type A sorting domain-containing protein [Arachidicoccus ginsenosidivorans]QEC73234.1 T9SS type A sorting domain-containing protein [Arachidicoccus ginsenosidivorans]
MDIFLRNKLRHPLAYETRTVKRLRSVVCLVTAGLTLLMSVIFGSLNQLHAASVASSLCALNTPSASTTTAPLTNALTTALSNPFNMDLSDNLFDTAKRQVSCYPNPAISYINFKFEKTVPKDAKLFVFSFTGRKMTELALTGAVIKVSLDNYYRGLYVYQLRSAGGAIMESGKFQVKN